IIKGKKLIFPAVNLILLNFLSLMQDRCLTGSGSMKEYGDWTQRETVPSSKNTSAKSGRSCRKLPVGIILKQSGGLVTNGSSKTEVPFVRAETILYSVCPDHIFTGCG